MHVGVALATPVVQTWPQEPQLPVSACSFTQAPAQGEKPPMHAYPQVPAEQVADAFGTVVVHAEALPHCPVELHVSTPVPEHRVAPGVQTPPH